MKKAPAIVLLILGSINAMAVVYACVEGLKDIGRSEKSTVTGWEREKHER